MTDRELDERIAKALGWVIHVDPAPYFTPWWVGVDGQATETPGNFSPATSVDALRKWVLPEIKRRELTRKFDDAVRCAAMRSHSDPEAFDILSCDPATLAAAALAVMEEDNAR